MLHTLENTAAQSTSNREEVETNLSQADKHGGYDHKSKAIFR